MILFCGNQSALPKPRNMLSVGSFASSPAHKSTVSQLEILPCSNMKFWLTQSIVLILYNYMQNCQFVWSTMHCTSPLMFPSFKTPDYLLCLIRFNLTIFYTFSSSHWLWLMLEVWMVNCWRKQDFSVLIYKFHLRLFNMSHACMTRMNSAEWFPFKNDSSVTKLKLFLIIKNVHSTNDFKVMYDTECS